jgi:hypothetical protein
MGQEKKINTSDKEKKMNNVPTQCQQDRINMIETTAREKLFTPLYDRLQSVCVWQIIFAQKTE